MPHDDAFEKPEGHQGCKERASAVAYEGQGNASDREKAAVGPDIYKRLDQNLNHDAGGNQPAEIVGGKHPGPNPAEEEQDEEAEKHHRPDKPKLLPDDAEDEVGVLDPQEV
jgi:hypothetical protein